MIIGIICYLVGIVVSRMISEKGLKALTDSEKASYLNAFSKFRMFSSLPVLAAGVIMILFIFFFPDYSVFSLLMFALLCIIYLVVLNIMMFIKLKTLNPPAEYRRYHILSRVIQYSGFLAFLLLFGYDWLFNLGYIYLLPFVGQL